MGRIAATVVLPAEDRLLLEGWAQRRKTAQALALRARIVLKAAAGVSATETASQMQLHLQTVGKWRRRYAEMGPDGLLDEPRPGAPRKLSDAAIEHSFRPSTNRFTDSICEPAAASRVSGNSKPIPLRAGCRVTTP